MISRYTIIILGVSLLCYINCHVSLIYPPPRYPPFDFLDTKRTSGACGVGRTNKPNYTTFLTKTSYDIYWNMPLIHKGGFRISLIDKKGNLQEELTPLEGNFYTDPLNETINSYQIKFTKTCLNCTLVLEKEQKEWDDSGIFHSCSDVQIIDINNENEDNINDVKCSGHGIFNGIKCSCDALYSGDRCQFKSLCTMDDDCKNEGRCISMKTNPIEKNCYCKFGFFGNKCEKKFIPTAADSNCFNFHYTLSQDTKRFLKYGLFNTPCYKSYKLNDNDIVYFRTINEEMEIILDYKTTSWLSLGWRPLELDSSCRLFPETGNNDKQNEGFLKSALESPLHPMDCNDIIFATIYEDYLRISDMYSRDRSTPLLDNILDGEDSLSAAYGTEIKELNRTIIMFRRNIREIEPTDMPLGPGNISFIWAKGYDVEESHNFNNVTKQFYEKDSFKYHGPKNRGKAIFEMISKESMPSIGRLIFIPEINQSVIKINPNTDDGINKNNNKMNGNITNPASKNIDDERSKTTLIKKTISLSKDKNIKNTSLSSDENIFVSNNKKLTNEKVNDEKNSKKITNTSDEEINNFDELENESSNTSESNEGSEVTLQNNQTDDDKDLKTLITTSIPILSEKNKTLLIKSLSNDSLETIEKEEVIKNNNSNNNGEEVKNVDTSSETVMMIYPKNNKSKNTVNTTPSLMKSKIKNNDTEGGNVEEDEDMIDDNSLILDEDETNSKTTPTSTTEKPTDNSINNKNSVWLPSENISPSESFSVSDEISNIKNIDYNEVSTSSLPYNISTFILLTILINLLFFTQLY
uniref:EGF-like domain-containing protein n=1 Tax=Strongyloides stercoralis TaxID=6248 RepID=A0A0K0EFU5_STRER